MENNKTNGAFPQQMLPAERPEEVTEEAEKVEEKKPDPPFIPRDFTIEQMAFIRSLQEPNMQSRMGIIQSIQWCIARTTDPEDLQMMSDAQNLLGCMTDEEYNRYSFDVDIEEPRIYEI